MSFSVDGEEDISWRTQEPSQSGEIVDAGFNLDYVEEEIPLEMSNNVVSLEEGEAQGRKLLYDNIMVEDISSDDCVDNM